MEIPQNLPEAFREKLEARIDEVQGGGPLAGAARSYLSQCWGLEVRVGGAVNGLDGLERRYAEAYGLGGSVGEPPGRPRPRLRRARLKMRARLFRK
jgi:hypothetical protein